MMEGWDSASWSPQEDQVRTLTVNGHEVICRAQIVIDGQIMPLWNPYKRTPILAVLLFPAEV